MTDTDIMPFGKYKKTNTRMIDVPADYLFWLHENASIAVRKLHPEVFDYILDNLKVIKAQMSNGKNGV